MHLVIDRKVKTYDYLIQSKCLLIMKRNLRLSFLILILILPIYVLLKKSIEKVDTDFQVIEDESILQVFCAGVLSISIMMINAHITNYAALNHIL